MINYIDADNDGYLIIEELKQSCYNYAEQKVKSITLINDKVLRFVMNKIKTYNLLDINTVYVLPNIF